MATEEKSSAMATFEKAYVRNAKELCLGYADVYNDSNSTEHDRDWAFQGVLDIASDMIKHSEMSEKVIALQEALIKELRK